MVAVESIFDDMVVEADPKFMRVVETLQLAEIVAVVVKAIFFEPDVIEVHGCVVFGATVRRLSELPGMLCEYDPTIAVDWPVSTRAYMVDEEDAAPVPSVTRSTVATLLSALFPHTEVRAASL